MENSEDIRAAEKLESAIHRIAGPKDMTRNRPYTGQHHTSTGERGRQLITGLTKRDLYDCMIRGYVLSHSSFKGATLEPEPSNFELISEAKKGEYAQLNSNDMFTMVGGVDPLAVIQNTLCEVEKMMGVFPNIPLKDEKVPLTKVRTHVYIGENGCIISREDVTIEPDHGVDTTHAWVIRKNRQYVDHDYNLHDLAERNNYNFSNA